MRDKSELRPYQDRLATALYERDRLITVALMGSGKTAAALTAAQELLDAGEIRHVLVIAPKRVAQAVWPAEVNEWKHLSGLRVAVVAGDPKKRLATLATACDRDVTVIGVDNTQWLVTQLEKVSPVNPIFDLLIFDETSRLKNPKSKRLRALSTIAPRFKNIWGLTGTVRPNGYLDLFGQAKLMTHDKLWGRSFYAWRQKNFHPLDYQGFHWDVLPDKEEQIKADFATISLTMDPADMPGLPPLNIIRHNVYLPHDAREIYDAMEKKLFAELLHVNVEAANMGVATNKCCQVANGFIYDNAGDAKWLHDEKHDWLAEMVEDLNGEPLIVVYDYKEDLERLQERFGDMPCIGHGVSDKAAMQAIDTWNRGATPLLFIHPYSAGHGLNLQFGGSQMAFLAPIWSSEAYDQTIKRIHRPGQLRPVSVHLCLAYETVDYLKLYRVVEKMKMQDAFRRYLKKV